MFDSEFETDSIYNSFSRREMMRAAVLSALGLTVPDVRRALCTGLYSANSDGHVPQLRCCVTDPQAWYFDTKDHIRKRFAIYKKIGVNLIRAEIDWAVAETEEGKWRTYPVCRYLQIAKEYGFHIKLIVGVMMSPPYWYLQKHPEAMLTDQNGGHSFNTMSYWYPKLRQVIDEKTKNLFEILNSADVWNSIDYLIPSFGPAGEPIYPAPWTLGPKFPVATFWGYDSNAQKSFRSTMKRKYRSIGKANSEWGTDFLSWDDVIVLQPKARPGRYWNDMLLWYRDTKRSFVEWQIDNMNKYAGARKMTLIYVPGTGFSEQDWESAVRTGDGDDSIKLMADSRFLIDAAAKKGCWLQYTGVENASEVERLVAYIDKRGYKGISLWGENAGFYDCAKDPVKLARIIINNRLYGLDLTHGNFLFKSDGLTPDQIMPELKTAFHMIDKYWKDAAFKSSG